MFNKAKERFIPHKELILYGVFGLATTIINIASFYVFYNMVGMQLIPANIVAWILAFLFAFITNKLFVFESKMWRRSIVVKEFAGFLTARLVTLVLDTALMWLLVETLNWNDLLGKIIVNIIVIILNYLASKLWIFKRK